jgi:hypothetical protein
MNVLARLFLIAMLWLAAPAAAVAATQSSTSQISVLSSLSVIKNSDLNFGTLVVSGAGTAVVDPVSGSETTTGLVTKSGTAAHPALFTGTGSKNSVVHIRLPNAPITVTRVGGTETMTVSTWTTDAPNNLKVPPNSTFTFNVGATLNVAAGQVGGTYIGTFNVTVQYP